MLGPGVRDLHVQETSWGPFLGQQAAPTSLGHSPASPGPAEPSLRAAAWLSSSRKPLQCVGQLSELHVPPQPLLHVVSAGLLWSRDLCLGTLSPSVSQTLGPDCPLSSLLLGGCDGIKDVGGQGPGTLTPTSSLSLGDAEERKTFELQCRRGVIVLAGWGGHEGPGIGWSLGWAREGGWDTSTSRKPSPIWRDQQGAWRTASPLTR